MKIYILNSLLLFSLLSCINYEKTNEINQKHSNIDSILLNKSKIVSFHKKIKELYWEDVRIEYINVNSIVCDSNYYNIGMYEYWVNSAHHPGSHYFLNFKDSICYIKEQDSIYWNQQIDNFVEAYKNLLSQKQKNILYGKKLLLPK
jgi:hypothetical protein